MKSHKLHLVVATLLFAAILPSRAFAQSQTSNDETQQLRKLVEQMQAQMSKMQEEIDQLKGTKSETPPSQPTVAPGSPPTQQEGTIQTAQAPLQGTTSEHVGEATKQYREFSEDKVAAPRFDNVPLDPKYHGFFRLPGTQDILKIGGYFKTDFIYDLKPAGNTDAFVPASFPIPQITSVNNATISIRPTRLNLDFRVPTTKVGEVRFLYRRRLFRDKFDHTKTASRLCTSEQIFCSARLSQISWTRMHLQIPWTSKEPNGMVSLRNPQFRYGFALSPSTTLYVSVEKPSSDVLFTTPLGSAQPNSPVPDRAIRLRQEFERGHIQVAAIFRDIAAYLPDGRTGSVFGWGVNTSTRFQNLWERQSDLCGRCWTRNFALYPGYLGTWD